MEILLKIKLTTSASFMAISKIIIIFNIKLQITATNPTHTTISIWVKKIGYYHLNKPKEKADDWIIILD